MLLALITADEGGLDIPPGAIRRGAAYLQARYCPAEELPAMWINKNLYNPYHIVQAAILAAMRRAEIWAQHKKFCIETVVNR